MRSQFFQIPVHITISLAPARYMSNGYDLTPWATFFRVSGAREVTTNPTSLSARSPSGPSTAPVRTATAAGSKRQAGRIMSSSSGMWPPRHSSPRTVVLS
ncbi:hypothetical protein BD414DRAFT_497066 [Trametes punicea]|nr:hypothetical protein BD414DRAFT_497066 [Trametes punicea]